MGTHGAGAALIVLSGSASQNENTAIGTAIGTVSVSNGTGTYTFTKTVDADAAFTLTGTTLSNSFAWDYETKTSHDVTIHADNGAGSVLDRAFTITVNNVLEVTLSALTLSNNVVTENTAAGTLIGNLTGKSAGSALLLLDNAGGRVALSGTALNTGATNIDFEVANSFTCTVRETHIDGINSPRDTVFTIIVVNALETVLNALTLSPSSILENSTPGTVIGNIGGRTTGSTVTMTNTAGNKVALSGAQVICGATNIDFEATPSFTFTLHETAPDAAPRDTTLTITVLDVVEGGGFTPSMKFNDARNSMYIGTGP
jgi:hypothetical protein